MFVQAADRDRAYRGLYRAGGPRAREALQARQVRRPGGRVQGTCCCCLPCNHCSNFTWVVEEILAYGNRLRSTPCRDVILDTMQTHCYYSIQLPKGSFRA